MGSFDVRKYQIPDIKNVNMKETRKNVGVFFSSFKSAEDRINQPIEPKITAAISDMPSSSGSDTPEAENILIYNEEAKAEYAYLSNLYIKGISAVQHPFKPDLSERRKKIFRDRYLLGNAFYEVANKNAVCEETARKEANYSLIQFANALNLIALR